MKQAYKDLILDWYNGMNFPESEEEAKSDYDQFVQNFIELSENENPKNWETKDFDITEKDFIDFVLE